MDNDHRHSSTLTAYGSILKAKSIRDKIDRSHPIISGVNKPADPELFGVAKTPIIVGEVYDRQKFSFIKEWENGLVVRDCLIKLNSSYEYHIPKELSQFDETISKIISYEHTINPAVVDYYAYLNIRQDILKAGEYHGSPCYATEGWRHIDLHRPITRSYMVYDRVPHQFYCSTLKYKQSYEEQVGAKNKYAVTPDPYSIILYDGYMVSKSTTVNYPYCRTSLTVTYDVLSRSNSYTKCDHNPMLVN